MSRNNRKISSLKNFRGVDYASSPLDVRPYRSTDMANLLMKDGTLHKRNGFRQVGAKIPRSAGYIDSKIYLYDRRLVGDYYASIYIVQDLYYGHPGFGAIYYSKFYTMTVNHNNGAISVGDASTFNSASRLGSAVKVGDTLYLFCGEYIKAVEEDGALTMAIVTSEDIYVPTTTINIPAYRGYYDADEKQAKFDIDSTVVYPFVSNESLNMLSAKQKNVLIGHKFKDNSMWSYYTVSGRIPLDTSKFTFSVIKSGTKTLLNDFEVQTLSYNDEEKFKDFDGKYFGYNLWGLSGDATGYESITRLVSPSTGIEIGFADQYLITAKDMRAGHSVVYIPSHNKNQFNGFPAGTDQDGNTIYTPISDVNIEIEFEDMDRDIEESKKAITTASVATIFGVDGANDRIFVSGSDVNPNMVFFSENDISLQPNPTYFPADQFLVCGAANTPVSAFMRVNDGTMAIFKDVSNTDDVAVYYTSGYYNDLGVGEEGNSYVQARFTIKAGGIRRQGISAKAISNLEGDNIFVSNDGVFGIQLSDNVASGEYYARERSRTINPKLRQFDLSKADGIVYKDKYYLAVGDGEVYVADARYTYTMEGDQQNTFNYEWFRLTDINVSDWFVCNNELYFIDKKGYICKFTDKYADEYILDSMNNEITVSVGYVTFNKNYKEIIEKAHYAIDDSGRIWTIEFHSDTAIKIPSDIVIEEGKPLKLWFYVPINAYWQSAVIDLENAMARKNLWALSVSANASHGGRLNLGYKTRLNERLDIEVEGANAFTFDDISFIGGSGYGMFSFDTSGFVGVNAYRRKVFERGFVYIQLLFQSVSTTDCSINDISVEYSTTIKNMGVG